jgi:cation diffusion facilitator family transporter
VGPQDASHASHDGHAHGHGDGHGGHGHSHATLDRELTTRREAIRAIWISVVGLGLTAVFQLVVVALSDSVSLFADALHNVGDVAGTAALWVGFSLSRRPADDRFTYGWRRAEDLAGLFIVLAILVSAVLAINDALGALLGEGHVVRNHGAAFVAALVGAVGNEAVAVYKIRIGRRIESVPLVADGQHARVDGLVSLAAAGGVAGSWMGYGLADPLVGLAIGLLILRILWTTARDVLLRTADAVEPDVLPRMRAAVATVEGVRDVHALRARWAGRSLLAQLHVVVDGDLTLRQAHDIGEEVRHALVHEFPSLAEVDVHVDPEPEHPDGDPHASTAHHFGDG